MTQQHREEKRARLEKLHGLYVITDAALGGGHLAIARAALDGGANILQLRDKVSSLRHILPIAHQLRRLTHDAGALFIVNDRVDVALWSHADGVHLGLDDFPPGAARQLLGDNALIGVSCHSPREAELAAQGGADYIGAGAIFATQTKSDAGAGIGLENLSAICRATTLPVAAIGGINARNIGTLAPAGARMACVISAVTGPSHAPLDVETMTRAVRELKAAFFGARGPIFA